MSFEEMIREKDEARRKGLVLKSREVKPKDHEYQMMDRVKKSSEMWEKEHNPTLEDFFS